MNHAQIKKQIQYSPRVFFILHANVVCTLTWVFSFVVFLLLFSRAISRHYIHDKNTVQPTQDFSFARSRFLVFPCEIVWLFLYLSD